MTLTTCTKYKKVIDSSNFAQVLQHNKDCGIHIRLTVIQDLIQAQDDQETMLQRQLLKNKKSGERLRVSQSDVSPSPISNRGAYTSSNLKRIPSDRILPPNAMGIPKGYNEASDSNTPSTKKRKNL